MSSKAILCLFVAVLAPCLHSLSASRPDTCGAACSLQPDTTPPDQARAYETQFVEIASHVSHLLEQDRTHDQLLRQHEQAGSSETCQPLYGYDFFGSDIGARGKTGVEDAGECCKLCHEESQCHAYAYRPDAKACFLKNMNYVEGKRRDIRCVSGTRYVCNFEDQVEYTGNAVGVDSAAGSQSDCCARCLKNTECYAFSFNRKTKVCGLKDMNFQQGRSLTNSPDHVSGVQDKQFNPAIEELKGNLKIWVEFGGGFGPTSGSEKYYVMATWEHGIIEKATRGDQKTDVVKLSSNDIRESQVTSDDLPQRKIRVYEKSQTSKWNDKTFEFKTDTFDSETGNFESIRPMRFVLFQQRLGTDAIVGEGQVVFSRPYDAQISDPRKIPVTTQERLHHRTRYNRFVEIRDSKMNTVGWLRVKATWQQTSPDVDRNPTGTQRSHSSASVKFPVLDVETFSQVEVRGQFPLLSFGVPVPPHVKVLIGLDGGVSARASDSFKQVELNADIGLSLANIVYVYFRGSIALESTSYKDTKNYMPMVMDAIMTLLKDKEKAVKEDAEKQLKEQLTKLEAATAPLSALIDETQGVFKAKWIELSDQASKLATDIDEKRHLKLTLLEALKLSVELRLFYTNYYRAVRDVIANQFDEFIPMPFDSRLATREALKYALPYRDDIQQQWNAIDPFYNKVVDQSKELSSSEYLALKSKWTDFVATVKEHGNNFRMLNEPLPQSYYLMPSTLREAVRPESERYASTLRQEFFDQALNSLTADLQKAVSYNPTDKQIKATLSLNFVVKLSGGFEEGGNEVSGEVSLQHAIIAGKGTLYPDKPSLGGLTTYRSTSAYGKFVVKSASSTPIKGFKVELIAQSETYQGKKSLKLSLGLYANVISEAPLNIATHIGSVGVNIASHIKSTVAAFRGLSNLAGDMKALLSELGGRACKGALENAVKQLAGAAVGQSIGSAAADYWWGVNFVLEIDTTSGWKLERISSHIASMASWSLEDSLAMVVRSPAALQSVTRSIEFEFKTGWKVPIVQVKL